MLHLIKHSAMRDRNKKKYALLIAAIVIISAIIAMCCGGEDSQSTKKSSPEGVLVEFTSALKTGDFDKAYSLSDTVSMKCYMNAYTQKWKELSKKDSATFTSIVNLLKETQIHFNDTHNEDGVCIIRYALELDGSKKEHQATLRKEEGEWKVVEITDKN